MSTSTTTLKQTTSADWDKTSSYYSTIVSSTGPMTKPLEQMLRLQDSHASFSNATGILDLGCGPGVAIAHLINTYSSTINPTAQILAGDFSPGMVRQASQLRTSRLTELPAGQQRDLWTRLTTLILDATNLAPLADASISHIIANFVLFLVNDPAKAVAEAYRVLTPSGVLSSSSWETTAWISLLAEAAAHTFAALHKPVPELPELPVHWRSTQAVAEQLSNAGFRDVKAGYVDTAMLIADPETWARSFVRSGNPGVTWVTDLLDEQGIADLETRLAEQVCRRCEVDEQGAFVLAGRAVVAVGRK